MPSKRTNDLDIAAPRGPQQRKRKFHTLLAAAQKVAEHYGISNPEMHAANWQKAAMIVKGWDDCYAIDWWVADQNFGRPNDPALP